MRIINVNRRYYHLKARSGEVTAGNVFIDVLAKALRQRRLTPLISKTREKQVSCGCVTAHKTVSFREYVHNTLGSCTHIRLQSYRFG